MAEDTREIRYYKGRTYYVKEIKGELVELEDTSSPSLTRLVESKNTMTEEEHQVYLSKQRSQHVNWIR